jgi:hypothetical protein
MGLVYRLRLVSNFVLLGLILLCVILGIGDGLFAF